MTQKTAVVVLIPMKNFACGRNTEKRKECIQLMNFTLPIASAKTDIMFPDVSGWRE
jgi:hypothetical protein